MYWVNGSACWQRTSNHGFSHQISPITNMNKRDAFLSSNFLLKPILFSQSIRGDCEAPHSCSYSKCSEGLFAVHGGKKKSIYICVPSWHSWGWCLLVRFGVCLYGLARLSSSPFTPIWGQGVVLVCGKLLILSRNECSKQKNVFSRLQSWMCPPLWFVLHWKP